MAALVFDAGALIALDRGDRGVGALLAAAARDGVEVTSHPIVLMNAPAVENSSTLLLF